MVCPLEQLERDPRSPGVIDDDEDIVRGAYDPMHFKGARIRPSVLRSGDLAKGQLSVWRSSAKSGSNLKDIESILGENGPSQHALAAMLVVNAQRIRELREQVSNLRLFCIVDECDTNEDGGWHRAHAHIALCMNLEDDVKNTDSERFVSLKEQLYLIFKQRVITVV